MASEAAPPLSNSPEARSPETSLVAALKAGEQTAQRVLVQRYHGRVKAVLHRVLGKDPELADLEQEVFVQAFTSIGRFRGDERTLEPWLVRVAVFTARAAIRKRQSWRRLFSSSPDSDLEEAPSAASPETREQLDRVYSLLGRLPDDQRIILALHMMDQMSLNEISDAVGVSRSTVIRKLKRAEFRFEQLAQRDPVLKDRLLRSQMARGKK